MLSEISGQTFQTFIQSLKKGNIIVLLQLRPFYEEIILPILKSKPSLVNLYRIHLQNLLNAIYNKLLILTSTHSGQIQIFPGVANIVQAIKSALYMDQFRRVKQVQDGIQTRDNYFLKFLIDQQMRMKIHDNSSYYSLQDNLVLNQTIKVRMPVLISSKTYSRQWQTLFTALRESFKFRKDQTLPQKKALVYDEIKTKRISFPLCLGCTQFYYERVNIRQMNLHQADVIVVSKIKQLNLHKDLLKNSICALLNSGGGIILFDCLEEYMQILPVGSLISEVQKELYMQQISQIFKYFHPRISFGINIQLKFVPVAQNPFKKIELFNIIPRTIDASPQFIKGKYVTRLRIWNNLRWQLITYDPNENGNILYIRKGTHTERVSGKQLPKLIKRVFKKYYCPQIWNKSLFQRPQSIFQDHQCVQPKMGIPLQTKQNDIQERKTQYDLQLSYNNISFIFMQDWPLKPFQKALKQGTGPLSIVPHDPPTSDNFCLLFHTTAHREMKIHFKIACEKSKNYHRDSNREAPMLFFVENCLRLQQPLDNKRFKELVNYIKQKNSTETLSYYEGEGNYYITSEFKATLFFLFAKLREMGYRNIQISKKDFNQLKEDKNYKIIEAPYHV